MKYLKLILLLISPFLFTGCWDYRELDHMSIVSVFGIDKSNDEFVVSMQIVNTNKDVSSGGNGTSSSGGTPVSVYSYKGKTIHEAARGVLNILPKRAYIGKLNVLILGEELAKSEKVTDYIDFLLRYPESRRDYNVIIAKGTTALEVMKILTPLIKNPGEYLDNVVKASSSKIGSTHDVYLAEFVNSIYLPGIEATTPAVEIIGNANDGSSSDNTKSTEPSSYLKVAGVSVYNDEKLIGYITSEQSVSYNILSNKLNSTVFAIPCDNEGNNASLSVNESKTKAKIKIVDNKPIANVEVSFVGELTELNCKINISKKKEFNKLENMVSKFIEEKVSKDFKVIQDNIGLDIFGYGLSVYRNNYSFWKNNQNDWNNLFSKMEYQIKVKVTIDDLGAIIVSERGGSEYEQ